MDNKEYGSILDNYTACGVIANIISLAKDTGILEILFQSEDPLSSQEIADRGGLRERYVREILSCLSTGRVVQVDETSSLFSIKSEFKPVLKDKSIFMRFIPYIGMKYDAIEECVNKAGPPCVRYEDHPVIFKVLEELRTFNQDKLVTSGLLPAIPDLADKLSSGIDVAEVGCASGTIILNLSQRFPKSRFTGSDVVESVLEKARGKASKRDITNCQFEITDVCHIPDTPLKQYDWIYARDVIHDLPDPQGALSGICRLLKPGGRFSMVEYGVKGTLMENVGNLLTSMLFGCSVFVCIPESYQSGQSEALGACWGVEKARELVEKAGLEIVQMYKMYPDSIELNIVCKRST